MITVRINDKAIEHFNHCECPNCFSDENVFTTTLSGVDDRLEKGIEEDILCCTDCRVVFDWVTNRVLGEEMPDELLIIQD